MEHDFFLQVFVLNQKDKNFSKLSLNYITPPPPHSAPVFFASFLRSDNLCLSQGERQSVDKQKATRKYLSISVWHFHECWGDGEDVAPSFTSELLLGKEVVFVS